MKIVLKKITALEDTFILLVAGYLFLQTISTGVAFSENILSIIYSVQSIWWNILRAFILIKIAIQFRKKDLKILMILTLAFFSSYYSSSYWVSELLWVMAGTKNVDLRRTIKSLFVAELFAFIIVVFLCLLGVVDNITMSRGTNIIRQSLGFNHPNALAARVFQLEAMYIYIMDQSVRFKNLMFITIINIIVYIITDSQTISILMVFMTIFVFALSSIYKKRNTGRGSVWRKASERVIKKMKYAAIAIPFVAIFLMLYLSRSSRGGTLFTRAKQAAIYLQYYGLSLFGQPLQINNGSDNYYLQQSKLYTLDNSYLYLLIGFGTIYFLLFIVGEIILIYHTIKEKNYTVAVILILYMIYGIAETMMIRFTYNFSLILLSQILWKKKPRKNNENIVYSPRKSIEWSQ